MNGKATFTRKRRFAIGLNVLVASILAPVIGALLVYLAFRPELRRRVDLTTARAFSLSERTLQVLEGLQKREAPVELFSCFRPDDRNSSGMPVFGLGEIKAIVATHCNDVLRELELRARGKIKAHLLDPNVTGHLVRITELARQIGEQLDNVVVARCGDRKKVVRLNELAVFDEGAQTQSTMTRPVLHGFCDEEALAAAILTVTEERQVKVGFLSGHGERSPQPGVDRAGNVGMAFFASALSGQNCAIATVELAPGRELTRDDVDVLVVAAPTQALAAAEIETLVRYERGGGRLLLLLDPSSATSLDFPLLQQTLGVQRTPHPVCQQAVFGDEWMRRADVLDIDNYSPTHPIVKPLRARSQRTIWQQACEAKPLDNLSDVTAAPLAWTGNKAWIDLPGADGKYNLQFDPATEKLEPHCLAVAVELKAKGGASSADGRSSTAASRAVVLGCATVLDDQFWRRAPGNHDFGLDLVDWLAEREHLIGSAPRPYDVVPLDLTPGEFNTIALYVVVGVPGLALVLGLLVWWMRRT